MSNQGTTTISLQVQFAATGSEPSIHTIKNGSTRSPCRQLKAVHHQLEMSRSVLEIFRPLLRPTLPSPTNRLHRLPRVSRSLPSRLAQSFQSRFESFNFSRTASTSMRSLSSSHSISSTGGEEPYAESSSDRWARGLVTGRSSSISSVGGSSARKSSADRPIGIISGILRRRFGVRAVSGVRQSCICISDATSSSNSLRRLLFALLCGGCCTTLGAVMCCSGSAKGFPSARGRFVVDDSIAAGAPSMACSARQLEESGFGRAIVGSCG